MDRPLRITAWLLLPLFAVVAGCGGQQPAAPPAPAVAAASPLPERLQAHVVMLSAHIGSRSVVAYQHLRRAADYICDQFRAEGYQVTRQTFTAGGRRVSNLIADQPGADSSQGIVLVGAHYDTYYAPGADDNASGVAAMLELARLLRGQTTGGPVRFVAFVNEEDPYWGTDKMGSLVYAKALRAAGVNLRGMLNLDMVGYYPGKNRYLLVGARQRSQLLADRMKQLFAQATDIPTRAIPTSDPGINWSDQWSFWRHGYRALFIIDPGYYHDGNIHSPRDTWEKLNYDDMAQVVMGLQSVVLGLSADPTGRLRVTSACLPGGLGWNGSSGSTNASQ